MTKKARFINMGNRRVGVTDDWYPSFSYNHGKIKEVEVSVYILITRDPLEYCVIEVHGASNYSLSRNCGRISYYYDRCQGSYSQEKLKEALGFMHNIPKVVDKEYFLRRGFNEPLEWRYPEPDACKIRNLKREIAGNIISIGVLL